MRSQFCKTYGMAKPMFFKVYLKPQECAGFGTCIILVYMCAISLNRDMVFQKAFNAIASKSLSRPSCVLFAVWFEPTGILSEFHCGRLGAGADYG